MKGQCPLVPNKYSTRLLYAVSMKRSIFRRTVVDNGCVPFLRICRGFESITGSIQQTTLLVDATVEE